jgi:hypothetical protein
MPIIHPYDLVGRSFFMNTNDDGEKLRVQVVEAVKNDDKLRDDPDRIKFVCSVNNEQYEEILSHNETLQHIENDAEVVWSFKQISAHNGPLQRAYSNYKGSK